MKNASSGSKFATGNMNFTDSEKVYGLVQCTPDISETDCRICLQRDMVELSECCGKKQGGRVLRPSCIAWFELSLFYDSSSIDTPSPTPFDPPLTPSFAPPEATRNKGMSLYFCITSLQHCIVSERILELSCLGCQVVKCITYSSLYEIWIIPSLGSKMLTVNWIGLNYCTFNFYLEPL